MSRNFSRSVIAAVLAAAFFGFTAPTASATTSAIQFGRIQYDSPGTDTRTNASLNGEYFVVKNGATIARNLIHFSVRDAQIHVYTFASFNLGAGKAVKVHTGKGTNTATDRYWGLTNFIWNNTGDTATMRNAGVVVIDTCKWTATGPGYSAC